MRRGIVPVAVVAPAAGALAAAVVAAQHGDGGPAAKPTARHGTVLRDGFGRSRLNRRLWSTCHWWADRGCTIASNHELEWYVSRQVRPRRGVLRLVARRHTVRGSGGRTYPYVSGMISSGPPHRSRRPKFAFRYGRAEIRARVPSGKGLWSAFWLLPADRDSKPEIDVMEILGHRPATVEMHLHYRRRDGSEAAPGAEWTDKRLRSGWHTFAVDWRPRKLVWLVDGRRRWSVTGRRVPHERMYLVANLAVGGSWAGRPSHSTRFPSAFEIDYVRVRK
jgi:beta-glucanase (GH16 family)